MSRSDSETTLQELKDVVVKFRDERGWKRHHQPKNLAMSICIEAAELLEHFQWDEIGERDKAAIADELADVLINVINFADVMDIDVGEAFRTKLTEASKKYPTSIFNPEDTSDKTPEYTAIKRAYRQKGKTHDA